MADLLSLFYVVPLMSQGGTGVHVFAVRLTYRGKSIRVAATGKGKERDSFLRVEQTRWSSAKKQGKIKAQPGLGSPGNMCYLFAMRVPFALHRRGEQKSIIGAEGEIRLYVVCEDI